MAKRTYRAGHDKMILRRLRDGSLEVNTETGSVFSRGRELVPTYDKRGYKFVRIYLKNARKAIGVHRIVWMKANNCLIPDGHQVHHKKFRWNNHIGNLELLSYEQHYFATYGRWPVSDEEALAEFNRS